MCEKNLEQRGIRMEQYKVILVDDEAEVIDIMEAKIRWSELGFEVVGSAKNGVKALELVEKLQPDVVLTDIRMPYMDGLELSMISKHFVPISEPTNQPCVKSMI